MPEYILANSQLEYEAAQLLFNEYAQWLNIDLCFQNFDKELQQLSIMYAATNGGIVLCKKDNDFIGCSAIRKIDTTSCELKRMWVQLPYQKLGIGETLLKECIALAKKLNYKEIRKQFIGKKPNTSYAVTSSGKKAFAEHLDALEKLIKSTN